MARELQLTVEDRAWLHAMDLAMPAMAPVPMVSAAQYQAAVDAGDLAVRQNQTLRESHRVLSEGHRRLWTRYRRQRVWVWLWAVMAVGMGFVLGGVWGR